MVKQQDDIQEIKAHQGSTYYRSRLFTANTGTNLLIASAQPLLILISRLIHTPQLTELQTLQQQLPHEIQAFTTRAQGFGYSEHFVSLACYLLCTALDDIIEQIGIIHGTPTTAMAKLQIDGHSDKFFALVNQLQLQPSSYIDLIELSYLIICVGYCGNYRFSANGRVELENCLENLYQVIRIQRGDEQPALLVAHQHTSTEKKSKTSIHLGWLTAMVVSIVLSFAVGFSYVINNISHSMIMQLK